MSAQQLQIEFEAYAKRHGIRLTKWDHHDSYVSHDANVAWAAWQASRAVVIASADQLLAEARLERDICQDCAIEAQATANTLKAHLREVLEICRTWEPDYSTGMDRKTLALAAEAAHG